jgi:hypothetical protein
VTHCALAPLTAIWADTQSSRLNTTLTCTPSCLVQPLLVEDKHAVQAVCRLHWQAAQSRRAPEVTNSKAFVFQMLPIQSRHARTNPPTGLISQAMAWPGWQVLSR